MYRRNRGIKRRKHINSIWVHRVWCCFPWYHRRLVLRAVWSQRSTHGHEHCPYSQLWGWHHWVPIRVEHRHSLLWHAALWNHNPETSLPFWPNHGIDQPSIVVQSFGDYRYWSRSVFFVCEIWVVSLQAVTLLIHEPRQNWLSWTKKS